MGERLPWVWDYDISADEFRAMLAGQLHRGRLGQDWAAVRHIEYAPYEQIVAWLGFAGLASASTADYDLIRWRQAPGLDAFCRDLASMAKELLVGTGSSATPK